MKNIAQRLSHRQCAHVRPRQRFESGNRKAASKAEKTRSKRAWILSSPCEHFQLLSLADRKKIENAENIIISRRGLP